MLYYLFVTLYVLTCMVLMIVILLQQGKGGDIANAFGGGASQAVFGARAGATVLTKVTTGLTVSFMTLALLLAVWGSRGTSSVVGGVDAPAQPQLPAEATAPGPASAPAATTTPPTTPASEPAAAPAATPAPAPAEPPPAKKQ
jgi:preprotein translocase subunit SecG